MRLQSKEKKANTRLIAIATTSFAILLFCLIMSVYGGIEWSDFIINKLEKLRNFGIFGVIVFFFLQIIVATIGILPASLIGIAAGAVYGLTYGFLISAVGVLIGAWIAFGLSRSATRPVIMRLLLRGNRLNNLDSAITKDGWRLVLLMRVSPLMPFSLTSYALGLSGVRFRDYTIGTLVSLPALFCYVLLGAIGVRSVTAVHAETSDVHLALLGIGVAATLLLTLRVGRIIALAATAGQ